MAPQQEIASGPAPRTIATGGMLPRGADAVVPVELTRTSRTMARPSWCASSRVPGAAVSFAGTDMGRGETVLFAGARLSSRETGVLAAIGRAARSRWCGRPRVAILSTGDEIVQPGAAMRPGPRLRQQRSHPGRCRGASWAASRASWAPSATTRWRCARRSADALARRRSGAALGRHLEGRRRSRTRRVVA